MTQEALKLALEYIEAVPDDRYNAEHIDRDALITAIEKALAQPEQEPLAYVNVEKRRLEFAEPMVWHTPTVVNLERIPLYTQQRTWVGLTDEEMESTFIKCGGYWNGDFWKIEDADFHPFLRTIEAKLKEKNT